MGKVEQSRAWSSAPLHLSVIAIEKGAFKSPSTMVANFTYFTLNYIINRSKDTGCNSEDLPEAMNDREKWREMVKDIRASGTT